MKILFLLLCLNLMALTVPAQGLQFYPLTPCRLVDTRNSAPISNGSSLIQTARGFCGIPAEAQAVVGNLTSVSPVAGGWFTVYASDATLPLTASSNYLANEVTNNVFTVGLGADGAFKVFSTATSHAVIDVTGYYAPPGAGGLYFHLLASPVRLLDTRPTYPACSSPGAPLGANSVTSITATGACGGAVVPAAAKAIVGNATTVNPAGSGWLTLFASGISTPFTSSGNYAVGETLNSQFFAGLSASGQVSVFTRQSTHLVVDVVGYFSGDAVDVNGAGLLFYPIAPVRLLDTRAGYAGCFTPGAPMTGGAEASQAVAGGCTVPVGAKAVVGNATVIQPVAGGWLTLWPGDTARPNIASSNFTAGQVFNRHFTVGLGTGGAFKAYSTATTNLAVDLVGYFIP